MSSVEMKNMYSRRPMPPLSSLSRDEINPGDLPVGEEVPFVAAYFGDQSDGYSNLQVTASQFNGTLEPELGRDGSHIVWVENARSGELLPTRVGSSGDGSSSSGSGDGDNAGEESGDVDETSPLILPKPLVEQSYLEKKKTSEPAESNVENIENGDASGHSYAAMFLRALFLLFQGMLAGFTFISVSYLVLSDRQFLATYQASANEVRRMCFVLSSLAALGAVDNLMSLISRSSRPSLSGADASNYGTKLIVKENSGAFVFAVVACVAYFAALILSVLLGGTDTLIYYKFGQDATLVDWVTFGLSTYESKLKTWRQLVSLRIAFACIGWLCSCFLVWQDLVAKDGRGHELVRLQNIIQQWRGRVNILEGAALEGMDEPSLRKLVALQNLGFERSSAALRVLEQM